RLARVVSRRALLPLHGGRRPPLPRRDPPSSMGAAARRGANRPEHDGAARPAGRPAARALRAAAGHGHLVAPRAVTASPQKRAALTSVAAAATLLVLKLVVGLKAHSLGLVSEAAHSGVDLVAATLTFFAVRVSARPADPSHQFGHGKAEHLSALAEAAFLAAASLFIGVRAVERLTGATAGHVDAAWYVFVVVGVVIAVDLSRTTVSYRASRAYRSPALAANALHFGSDLAGSFAVLIG